MADKTLMINHDLTIIKKFEIAKYFFYFRKKETLL